MLGQKMAGHWASALQPQAGPSRAQRPGDILPLVSAGGTGGDRRWLGQEVAGTGLGTLGHGAARGVWNACVLSRYPYHLRAGCCVPATSIGGVLVVWNLLLYLT